MTYGRWFVGTSAPSKRNFERKTKSQVNFKVTQLYIFGFIHLLLRSKPTKNKLDLKVRPLLSTPHSNEITSFESCSHFNVIIRSVNFQLNVSTEHPNAERH